MKKEDLVKEYNKLVDLYNKTNEDYIDLINLITNIDFQCYCAKLKTPTIKHITEMIKEYHNKEK
jgi:hypothetical protein